MLPAVDEATVGYVQNGVVLRYSAEGELLDTFTVGIIPGAFCWR